MLWQLVVESARHVLAHGADLILDDVMVVAEPVLRRNRLRCPRRGRQEVVPLAQDWGFLVEQRQERTSARRIRRQLMRGGQRGRMRFELLLAEEDRRFRLLLDTVGTGGVCGC